MSFLTVLAIRCKAFQYIIDNIRSSKTSAITIKVLYGGTIPLHHSLLPGLLPTLVRYGSNSQNQSCRGGVLPGRTNITITCFTRFTTSHTDLPYMAIEVRKDTVKVEFYQVERLLVLHLSLVTQCCL
jgi:hypothetical protein